jgi:hypothetical protein
MHRYFTLILGILFSILSGIGGVSAYEIKCPAEAPMKESELTPAYFSSQIELCLTARSENREASVGPKNGFYCPSGQFFIDDSQPTSTGRLATQIAASIYFNEIDKEILQYICKLREIREKDIVVVSNDINKTLYGKGGIFEKYDSICRVSFIMNKVNDPAPTGKKWVNTTTEFPESICEEKIKRKKDLWVNLAYIMMADGAAKGYQNDKDTFIDKIKSKYDIVREKFHNLLKLLDKAGKNTNALPDNPLK